MLIRGLWIAGGDGVSRPMVLAEMLSADGNWTNVPMLIDTGADRTVLSATALVALGLSTTSAMTIGGIGGTLDVATVATTIRFLDEANRHINLRGDYVAVEDPTALDVSVLGRDVTGLFAIIVDQPNNDVLLLGQRHTYTVIQR